MAKKIHIVPHFHWDREWYFTTSRSKIYLMKDLGDVLNTLEKDPEFKYFMLDAQGSLLDDYIKWRPEDEAGIKRLVQAHRLVIGPWYTQSDLMVISAESIVRNMYYGMKTCLKYGPYMNVGYVPDSFGMAGNMPQIYNAFGIKDTLFWRGVTNDMVKHTDYNWRGHDGSTVFVTQIPHGYYIGGNIPEDDEDAKKFWKNECLIKAGTGATDNIYFPNGFDQAPIRRNLVDLVKKQQEADPENTYVISCIEDYIKELDEGISSYMTSINQVILKLQLLSNKEYENFLKYVNGDLKLSNETDPSTILETLKSYASTIVPKFSSDPEIEFSFMDVAVAKITNTVAYYTKSPIDSSLKEYITLNGLYLNNDTDELITTIAHEGYPGHLYEYVYLKELGISNVATLMTNTGHGEGWACYVEEKLYDYLADKSSSKAYKLYCEYSKYNFLVSYLLYARVDAGINYEGWNTTKLASYLNENGFNGDVAEELYDQLIEMPTVYASYGYGSLKMHKYHLEAKNKLKSKYDEIEFNKIILSHGWAGFETLDKLVIDYLK